jgi:hypothetical protein
VGERPVTGKYLRADQSRANGVPVVFSHIECLQLRRRERHAIEEGIKDPETEVDENAAVRTALQRLHARPRCGVPGSASAIPPTGLPRMKRKGISALHASSNENGWSRLPIRTPCPGHVLYLE